MKKSLRILSRNARKEDVKAFLEESLRLTAPGDRNNIDAILQVSASANQKLYEEVRRDSIMCEALRELMKDTILDNIKSLMHNLNFTAEQAMNALNIPLTNRSKFVSKL